MLLAVSGLATVQTVQAPQAAARSTFGAPFMGWSSWSNEATTHPNYGTGWLNEGNIKNAADALNAKLKAAGYNHIDIDAGWDADAGWNFHTDGNGIPNPDPGRFPDGISGVATYVHNEGLYLGIYGAVGMAKTVYDDNYPIAGTGCHTQDIVVKPLTATNKWGTAWKIDYSNPCAQSYIDSIVAKYASWGVDLIKIDGVTPDNVADARAWSAAIDHSGRQMWLTASAWPVDIAAADGLKPSVNGVRVDTDVECYCDTVSSWNQSVSTRWSDLPDWLSHLDGSFRPDLDSMPINNNTGTGVQDGITDTERQTVFNFWSMASSPLYVGGDIYFMDAKAVSILSDPEVIAVDQSSVNPVQVTSGGTQIWKKTVAGDTYAAVYNMGSSTADIPVSWSQLGLSGTGSVRDVDARTNLGAFTGGWTARAVPAHGSRLIKISGASTTGVVGYEAEAGRLGGTAAVSSCAACSGGAKAGYLGNGSGNDLTVTVDAAGAGTKTLTIWYLADGTRPLALSVDGTADQTFSLSGGDWNYPVSVTTTIRLAPGANTLRFHQDDAYAPDIDRVTVG